MSKTEFKTNLPYQLAVDLLSQFKGEIEGVIYNILCNGFYNNDWCYVTLDEAGTRLLKDKEYKCREEKWLDVLKAGGYIVVTDIEDDDTEHKISMENFYNAWYLAKQQHPDVVARILTEEDDMIDSDCIIQYATFGDWVYG